jgi:hypothetical protein
LNRKIRGPGPQAMHHGRAHGPPWTDSGADMGSLGHGGTLARAWRLATLGHGSSLVRAQKRERSIGNPSQASPELGQWCGGSATAAMELGDGGA